MSVLKHRVHHVIVTASEVDKSCCDAKVKTKGSPEQAACTKSFHAAREIMCTKSSRKKAPKGSVKWCKCNKHGQQLGGAEQCVDTGGGRNDVCKWDDGNKLCVPSKATAGSGDAPKAKPEGQEPKQTVVQQMAANINQGTGKENNQALSGQFSQQGALTK